MVDRFERFTFAITEIYRCWRKIATSEMEKFGLKGACATYLITIRRYSEGITSAQLSSACGKNKADVSRAISDMERKGLIIRENDGNNLYRARITLTEAGKNATDEINNKIITAVEIGGKGLSDEQRTAFYEALDIIADNLFTLSKEGLPH